MAYIRLAKSGGGYWGSTRSRPMVWEKYLLAQVLEGEYP